MNAAATALIECYDPRWLVRSRDVLSKESWGEKVEQVRFWALVATATSFAVVPMVLRDGQLIAAQGKVEFVDETA